MNSLKKLNNMTTAKEFIVSNEIKQGFLLTNSEDELNDIIKSHVEFAKHHVEAAKKEYHKVLVKQGIVTAAGVGYFDNVYSIDNIK